WRARIIVRELPADAVTQSRSAKRVQDALGRVRRERVVSRFGLISVRMLQHCEQLAQWSVVTALRRIEGTLYPVIAGNERRIGPAHHLGSLGRALRIL